MVRFADYLQREGVEFLCVCASESYALEDLKRHNIASTAILPIEISPDFYYANRAEREALVNKIASAIDNRPARVVTFCMRDLYTVSALAAKLARVAVVHLILHIQDDLYVGQTVLEKLLYRMTGRLRFGNSKIIKFNRSLLSMLNARGGLICMADLIAEAWRKKFGILIPHDHVVPLPSFVATPADKARRTNNRKILWIGRLVDFKIPALLAMIDCLSVLDEYTFTIVGGGDRSAILARMKERNIQPDRVRFSGEVSYADLEGVIADHSIGYAMGTSLVELARFRIPVIVALASYAHTPFRRPICGGLFFDQPRGCDGSALAACTEDSINVEIMGAIKTIETDWKDVANACYDYARLNYSAEENFSVYKNIINNAKWLSAKDKSSRIPVAPLIRRFLFALKAR